MNSTYFKTDNIIYFIPDTQPGEERLWSIFNTKHHDRSWHVSNIKDSSLARLRHNRKVTQKHRQLFARISEMEGKGSKMAFKIIEDHPYDPTIIMGIDVETGEVFDAKYAETEKQLIALSQEYDNLRKLEDSDIVPKILEYKQGIDTAFLKITRPEGEVLKDDAMSKELIDFAISMTQFSINQYKEENILGLITCLSNGTFAPWNIVRDEKGKLHFLYWHHAADRPLGYDLIYYLGCKV